MGSRRMTGDNDPARITAARGDLPTDPADGSGGILDEPREGHLGIQPIVGNNHQIAPRRQHLTDEPVAPPVTLAPAAAIQENDRRPRFKRRSGTVHIQLAPRPDTIGNARIEPVPGIRHQPVDHVEHRTGREQRQNKAGGKNP